MHRKLLGIAAVGLFLTFTACKKQQSSTPEKSKPDQTSTETEKVSGKYTVDTENSTISFTSIKNGSIPVSGYFTKVNGDIEVKKGDLSAIDGEIALNLSTIDTGNPPRDDSLLTHFFETKSSENKEKTASNIATFSIDKIEGADTDELEKQNQPVRFKATGTLSLHGTDKKQTFALSLTRTGSDTLRVQTVKPFGFSIEEFGMSKQLEKLMEVCGHKSVSDAVPINLSLAFKKAQS